MPKEHTQSTHKAAIAATAIMIQRLIPVRAGAGGTAVGGGGMNDGAAGVSFPGYPAAGCSEEAKGLDERTVSIVLGLYKETGGVSTCVGVWMPSMS